MGLTQAFGFTLVLLVLRLPYSQRLTPEEIPSVGTYPGVRVHARSPGAEVPLLTKADAGGAKMATATPEAPQRPTNKDEGDKMVGTAATAGVSAIAR